ncbi:MAG: hypothetical protein QOJ20_2205, partial [Mycobacterium sp.]|nr:hypothetical protein [Mycobacterium sp.]
RTEGDDGLGSGASIRSRIKGTAGVWNSE